MKPTTKQPGISAESAVIGALLTDESLVRDMLLTVREKDFGNEMNGKIFRAAKDLYFRGKPVTPITLRDRVGKEAESYMVQLLEITITTANWREHARIMHEDAVLRRSKEIALEIIDSQNAENCRALSAKLQQEQAGDAPTEVYEMAELLAEFSARQTAKEPVRYIETGNAWVDGGTFIQRGDVMVIGGRPSDGKTLLALQFGLHMAREWKVGFFSLETSRQKLADRIAAAMAEIDFGAIKRRELSESEWERFAIETANAERLKFSVVEASGFGVDEIMRWAEALELDVLIIDYIQLIRPANPRAMRSEQIAEISRALHSFAQRTKTLIIELAQLSRPERSKGNKNANEPYYGEASMFDLKESGQIEQDADLVLLLSRPNEKEGYGPKKQRKLRVEKNKEGRTGSSFLYLDGAHQCFIPITAETAKDRDFERKIMEQRARRERMSGAKRR